MHTRTARSFMSLISYGMTFFSSVRSSTCHANAETYFSPANTLINYKILRYCTLGALGGGTYSDQAISKLAESCGATINDDAVSNYNLLSSWFNDYVEFYRGQGQANATIFEECVMSLFGQAEADMDYDAAAADRWTSIGLYIFLGLLFVCIVTCCMVGYVSERRSECKKAVEKEKKDIEHVEEIVIPVLTPKEMGEEGATSEESSSSTDTISSSQTETSSSKTTEVSVHEEESVEKEDLQPQKTSSFLV